MDLNAGLTKFDLIQIDSYLKVTYFLISQNRTLVCKTKSMDWGC